MIHPRALYTTRSHRLQTPLRLLLAVSLFILAGCVATDPTPRLGLETLEPGKAAVLVAVNDVPVAPGSLSLTLDAENEVNLQRRAIHRIALDPGWYRLVLNGLPQPDDNAMLRHRFEAGEVYRFALIERIPEVEMSGADSTATDSLASPPDPVYVVVASTPAAYNRLLQDGNLPVVDRQP